MPIKWKYIIVLTFCLYQVTSSLIPNINLSSKTLIGGDCACDLMKLMLETTSTKFLSLIEHKFYQRVKLKFVKFDFNALRLSILINQLVGSNFEISFIWMLLATLSVTFHLFWETGQAIFH